MIFIWVPSLRGKTEIDAYLCLASRDIGLEPTPVIRVIMILCGAVGTLQNADMCCEPQDNSTVATKLLPLGQRE